MRVGVLRLVSGCGRAIMPAMRAILLLQPWAYHYSREVARGVLTARYQHRDWELLMAEVPPEHEDPQPERYAHLNGAIAHLHHRGFLDRLRRLRIPVVNTGTWIEHPSIPRVGVDDDAIGRLAAEHLTRLGAVRCLFCGHRRNPAHRRRWLAFRDALAQRDIVAQDISLARDNDAPPSQRVLSSRLTAALQKVEDQAALFAADDFYALLATRSCLQLDRRIPEDLAILGVNDDPFLAQLTVPPLSSIRLPLAGIGEAAVALMDRLLAGEPPPDGPVLLQPVGLSARRSTDLTAVADPELAAALSCIRERLAGELTVGDLAAAAGISRRSLEQRFRRTLGRSPLAEIRRQRVEHIKHLLLQTPWSLDRIAAASGCASARSLCNVFRKEVGCSPGAYRRQERAGEA